MLSFTQGLDTIEFQRKEDIKPQWIFDHKSKT